MMVILCFILSIFIALYLTIQNLNYMELIFATQNRNKLAEIQQLMPGRVLLKGLLDIGCTEDIPETSPDLEGNALQKARYVYEKYKVNCFSDDTGLEIEALNGEPGVLSARYAGPSKDAEDNMALVLGKLGNSGNRNARFRTAIALILEGKEYLFEGIVNGEILLEKKGDQGFGYDPIFVPEGETRSFAEMTMAEKGTMSHRKRALEKLLDFLNSLEA